MAITSSFHPDPQTHIEPVRYGRGSNAMGLLQSVLVDGGPHRRPALAGRHASGSPRRPPGCCRCGDWSRADGDRAGDAVAGQLADHPLAAGAAGPAGGWSPARATARRTRPGSRPATQAARLLAEEIGGTPGGSLTEPFDIPMTAHILGGAVIGASPADGVIDP